MKRSRLLCKMYPCRTNFFGTRIPRFSRAMPKMFCRVNGAWFELVGLTRPTIECFLYKMKTDASNNLHFGQNHFALEINHQDPMSPKQNETTVFYVEQAFFSFVDQQTNFRMVLTILICWAFERPSLIICSNIFPTALHVFLHPLVLRTQKTRNSFSSTVL